MKKLFVVFLMLVLLCGCTSEKEPISRDFENISFSESSQSNVGADLESSSESSSKTKSEDSSLESSSEETYSKSSSSTSESSVQSVVIAENPNEPENDSSFAEKYYTDIYADYFNNSFYRENTSLLSGAKVDAKKIVHNYGFKTALHWKSGYDAFLEGLKNGNPITDFIEPMNNYDAFCYGGEKNAPNLVTLQKSEDTFKVAIASTGSDLSCVAFPENSKLNAEISKIFDENEVSIYSVLCRFAGRMIVISDGNLERVVFFNDAAFIDEIKALKIYTPSELYEILSNHPDEVVLDWDL